MKKICWVTPACFIETDIHVIPQLKHSFDIVWYIVTDSIVYPFRERIEDLSDGNLKIKEFLIPNGGPLSFSLNRAYWRLFNDIRAKKPAIVYSAILGFPFIPLSLLFLKRDKVVFAAHNVNTPRGTRHFRLVKAYNDFCYWHYRNFQTFSRSQFRLLESRFGDKNVFYAPFVLKDYGDSSLPKDDIITFLFFGRIRQYKAPDVVIRAAEIVKSITDIPFKVIIAGECTCWEEAYKPLIKSPELFELHIYSIPNKEVSDLFARSHFMLLPYMDIAQSGALFVGINYGVPAIISDLPAFREILSDQNDSLFIRPSDESDLVQTMIKVLSNFDEIYPRLRKNLIIMRDSAFSTDSIINRYSSFFDTL